MRVQDPKAEMLKIISDVVDERRSGPIDKLFKNQSLDGASTFFQLDDQEYIFTHEPKALDKANQLRKMAATLGGREFLAESCVEEIIGRSDRNEITLEQAKNELLLQCVKTRGLLPPDSGSSAPALSGDLAENWHAFDPQNYEEVQRQIGTKDDLISGILPRHGIGLVAGDSGRGKTPLLYEMAVGVAAGVPVLGREVQQGRVLCCDFENGFSPVGVLVERLSKHAGLSSPPQDLIRWNIDSASPDFNSPGHTIFDLIRCARPALVIIDSLSGCWPEIEESNSVAAAKLNQLRELIAEVRCAIVLVHNLRKPPTDPKHAPPSLEDADFTHWFLQIRGPRALVNGVDARIGVDKPKDLGRGHVEGEEKPALFVRVWRRLEGETARIYLTREMDKENPKVPLGYNVLSQVAKLKNTDQQAAYSKLPSTFEFKDAMRVYDRADQPTRDFLLKCIELRILSQTRHGQYEKVPEIAE